MKITNCFYIRFQKKYEYLVFKGTERSYSKCCRTRCLQLHNSIHCGVKFIFSQKEREIEHEREREREREREKEREIFLIVPLR